MFVIEVTAIGVVLLAALSVLTLRSTIQRRLPYQLSTIALLVAAGSAIFTPPEFDYQVENYLPRQTTQNGYVSSSACRSCHPGEYHSWHRSYHRTMTQVASPESVRGDFEDVQLAARGREYSLYRDGDEFWIRMADPEWEQEMVDQGMKLADLAAPPIVDRRVLMTTGSHHYQTYWTAGTRGREMFQVPWVFHLNEKRWLPRQDAFIAPQDSERAIVQWNERCITCHSTGGNPGLVFVGTGTQLSGPAGQAGVPVLDSEVGELGISCEACHGPGEDHVRRHQNPLTRYSQHASEDADPTIVNPAKVSPERSSQICGQCHSISSARDAMDWWQHGSPYRPGEDLAAAVAFHSFADQQPDDPVQVFWGDGTCRVGGREYLAMTASTCFASGKMSCLSCHSLHESDPNDQLSTAGLSDEACFQCHDGFRSRVEEHTHHAADSTGSRCYNCHMPHTSYALFSALRSHRVDSPSATVTAETGRPNACNQCHVDQSLNWTADHLADWYGQPEIADSDPDRDTSATVLWLLKGDAVQRTLAAWTLGWEAAQSASGQDWIAPLLASALEDPYPSVRFVAWKSLRTLNLVDDEGFNFQGNPDEFAAVADRIRQEWAAARSTRDSDSSIPQSLRPFFDTSGQLDLGAVRGLQSQRDNRPIVLPE
jgi:predicted CXXCH cytochrome family protein